MQPSGQQACSIHRVVGPLVHFIPQSKFDPIPQSQFVVNDAKVVLDDVLGRTDAYRNVAILEPLRNKLDDSALPFVRDAVSIAVSSKHGCRF